MMMEAEQQQDEEEILVAVEAMRLVDFGGRKGVYTGTINASSSSEFHHHPQPPQPRQQGVMVYTDDPVLLKYSGDWNNQGRWKRGQLVYRSGDTYVGTFDEESGCKSGFGTLAYEDGRTYEGAFQNDLRHGKGVFTWPDGRSYSGDFYENQRHGQGVFHAPGVVYRGEFFKGVYHGYGIYQREDKSVYRGNFENGQPHGHGTHVNREGEVIYEGEWEHGKPLVKHQVQTPQTVAVPATNCTRDKTYDKQKQQQIKPQPKISKKQPIVSVVHNQLWESDKGRANYRGLWNDEASCPTGNGTAEYEDSDTTTYEGCFDLHGQWHGRGRWTSSNGDVYEGNFVSGERHGFGIYTWSDGRQYQGSFEHNIRQGQGVMVYSNNDLYEGEFCQGNRHGQGRFIFANGAVYQGEWVAGMYHGQGKLVGKDGKTYEGCFKQGLPHGHGKEVDANGKVTVEGIWKLGQPAASDGEEDVESDHETIVHVNGEENNGNTKVGSNNDSLPNGASELSAVQSLQPTCPPPTAAPPALPLSHTASLGPPGYYLPKSMKAATQSTSPLDSTIKKLQQKEQQQREYDNCKAVVDQLVTDAQGYAGRFTGIVCELPANADGGDGGVDEDNGEEKNKNQKKASTTLKPHGVGRMVYADGKRIHEGFWKNGNKHGHGRCLFFPQGDWHEGEYVGNVRHGRGTYHWKDGRIYEGEYAKDFRHGQGVFSYPTKEVYIGGFVKGQRSGYGRFEFADGVGYYEGEWRAGRYHGRGKLVCPSQTCAQDTTSPVKTNPSGHQPLVTYEGEFVAGLFHGAGTKTEEATGIVQQGIWEKGIFCGEHKQGECLSFEEDGQNAPCTISCSESMPPPEDFSESSKYCLNDEVNADGDENGILQPMSQLTAADSPPTTLSLSNLPEDDSHSR